MFSFVFGSFVLFHVQYINKQKLKGKNSVVQRYLPFIFVLFVFYCTFQSASPLSPPQILNVGSNLYLKEHNSLFPPHLLPKNP